MKTRDKRVTQRFYNDLAKRLTVPHPESVWDEMVAHVRSCFDRAGGNRALDMGCGTAEYTDAVAGNGRVLLGVDFSQGAVANASRFYGNGRLELVCGDLEMLPVMESSIDLAFSIGVLGEYVPVETALAEAARVLRPGGVLTFTFMNLLQPYRIWKMAMITAVRFVFGADFRGLERIGGRMLARFPCTRTHVLGVAERLGFVDVQFRNLRDCRGHYLTTCVKR